MTWRGSTTETDENDWASRERPDTEEKAASSAGLGRGVLRVVFWTLLVGGWGLALASVYVVRVPGRVMLIPKDRLTWSSTVVDTTGWSAEDLQSNREVVARMVSLGHARQLAHLLDPNSPLDPSSQLIQAITQAVP